MLELTADDFVAWAEADPSVTSSTWDSSAAQPPSGPTDFPRSTRGYLLAPARPPTTVILQPDGTIERPEHPGTGRWGCDPAGLLVLNIDSSPVPHGRRPERAAHRSPRGPGCDDGRAGAAGALVGRGHRHRCPGNQPLGHRAHPPVRASGLRSGTSSSGADRGSRSSVPSSTSVEHYPEYQHLIVNDDLERAYALLRAILS